MVTIRDVAKKSGFSPTTVSFVLNDAPLAKHIPDETKERIRRVVQDLGYQPNVLAKYLRNKRSNTIGVVLFDITDPYCTQVLRGVENGLHEEGGYLPILTDTQNIRAHFRRHIKMLLERQVEGLVTLANSLQPEDEILTIFRECRIPVVIIGRKIEDGSLRSVTADNELGARLAVEHLFLLGHRRIAFIRGPKNFIDTTQRWRGVTGFARSAGLKLDNQLIADLPERQPNHEAAFALTRQLLERKRKFTALMAFDDMSAFGAIRALGHAGLRVPEDCSVIGFDDVATSAYYNPPLTTIRQDMELLGSTGAEILLSALAAAARKEPWSPVHRTIEPGLVVRESVAPPVTGK